MGGAIVFETANQSAFWLQIEEVDDPLYGNMGGADEFVSDRDLPKPA